ncbi:MAG: hypothetical protein JO219_02590 [Candidatus Eremiobacteraeota bacterium]|nr:hypothetical protein [Candidatus Eremiobacteraeota bacterium]MBV8366436.1 hypothetical protein [Candidatus Eremiobacteraeota bacterium]
MSRRQPIDIIRIVPMRLAGAAPPTTPQLTYRGGALLTAVEVTTIFWGAWWKQAPQSTTASELNAFFDYILTSALIDQLAEYDVAGMKIGHGSRVATLTVAQSPATTVDDTAIRSFLDAQLKAGSVPAAGKNSLYFIYLPSGVTVTMSGQASCQAFCGYHDAINEATFYAVEPYPDCQGCLGGASEFDALTITSSHELCEAVTDPVPGQGWYDDANGEIGDICAWQTKKVGAYTVQLEWSNAANACK